MTRKRRHELLPPPSFTGPDTTAPDGLSMTATTENGTESRTFTLEKHPGATQLRTDLIAALVELNGPRGPWRSINTVDSGHRMLGTFLRWLDSDGHHPRSVADITVATWNAWVLRSGGGRTNRGVHAIGQIRRILACAPGRSPDLVEAMARRGISAPTAIQESYSEDTYRRIRREARKVVHAAARRISGNYALVLQRQSRQRLSAADRIKADALVEVWETGEASTTDAYKALGAYQKRARRMRLIQQSLFLTPHEAWAAVVLLAAEAGWNSSVIDRLTLPDNSIGAGDDIGVYTVLLDKPRRGYLRHSTTTVLANSDVGRTLTWIISATEPARAALAQMGQPSDRLIIYGCWHQYSAGARFRFGIPSLSDTPEGWPPDLPRVSLQKLRRTHQVIFDQTPSLNTRKTHEDTYLRNDQATHERAIDVIETGLHNALNAADVIVNMRIVPDADVSEDIRSGRADTILGACSDFEHHPGTGTTCVESFLTCLGCTNAIATPRHLTRLVVMHDALEELSSAVDADQWRQRWEIHFARLRTLLERHSTAAEQHQARTTASDADRAAIIRLLTGGFSAA